MNRRQFGRAALAPLVARSSPREAGLEDLKKYTVTKVTGFAHVATRARTAGGDAVEDVLRVETNVGVEGFGLGSTTPGEARGLLGKSLDAFWRPGVGVLSPLDRSDHALYDLIGKALALPSWQVLGGMGPDWVPVCTGGLDSGDLPGLLRGVEEGLKAGHRAFTIGVGRGGFARDVEAVKAVRKLVGKGPRLLAVGDNGSDLEEAERWLGAAGDDLFLVESLFPEQVERNLLLKAFLRGKKLPTLVAGGGSAAGIDDLSALVKNGATDVFRPDARRWGLTRLCTLARKLSGDPRLRLAPHGLGSFLGLYLQLAVGRAVPNFLFAEQSPLTSDLFDTSAYVFVNGKVRVPHVPGFGITLKDDVFRSKYAKNAWVVA